MNPTPITDGTTEAYCYDGLIEYDFSELYEKLNNVKANTISPNKKLKLSNGKIKIVKYCYINEKNEEFAKNNLKEYVRPNFNSNFANVKLNMLGNEYTYEIDKTKSEDYVIFGENKQNEGFVRYIFSYPMKLKQENWMSGANTIIVSNNQELGKFDTTLQLNEQIFSNITNMSELNKTLYNQMFKDNHSRIVNIGNKKYYTLNGYFYGLVGVSAPIEKEEEALICNMKTEVTPRIYLKDTKFRVISLSYPFPGKDGQSRLPGLNWLNAENNVYNYITNNRNIQSGMGDLIKNPEMMYVEKNPIYVIELNAENMIKTREYNKTHTYTDLDLVCLENGTKCLSVFIRDNFKLDGECMYGGYAEHILRYAAIRGTSHTNSEILQKYGKVIKNFDSTDFGDKGVVNAKDASDYLIKARNKFDPDHIYESKDYTNFYYCADKTEQSTKQGKWGG